MAKLSGPGGELGFTSTTQLFPPLPTDTTQTLASIPPLQNNPNYVGPAPFAPLGGGKNGINAFPNVAYTPQQIVKQMMPVTQPYIPAKFTQPQQNPGFVPGAPPSGVGGNITTPGAPTVGGGQGAVYNSPSSTAMAQMSPQLMQYLQQIAQPNSNWMADLLQPGSDAAALQQIVSGGGNPFDATDVWQRMKTAQQRTIDENAAQLNEKFNVMGGRFSSSFGNAMGDYYSQTAKDQDALLGQLQMASYENAQGRNLSAAQQLSAQDQAQRLQQAGFRSNAASMLGQLGFQGLSQQSAQDFQAFQNKSNQAWQAAMLGSQQAASAASQLAATGNAAGVALYNTQNNAINTGTGLQTGAMTSQFGAQQQNYQSYLQSYLQSMGLSAQMAAQLAGATTSQGQLGLQMGTSQYTTMQDQINRLYQEWMRTQPAYNPLLPMMSQIATQQSPYYYPQRNPSSIGSIIGGLGGLLSGIAAINRSFVTPSGGGNNPSVYGSGGGFSLPPFYQSWEIPPYLSGGGGGGGTSVTSTFYPSSYYTPQDIIDFLDWYYSMENM